MNCQRRKVTYPKRSSASPKIHQKKSIPSYEPKKGTQPHQKKNPASLEIKPRDESIKKTKIIRTNYLCRCQLLNKSHLMSFIKEEQIMRLMRNYNFAPVWRTACFVTPAELQQPSETRQWVSAVPSIQEAKPTASREQMTWPRARSNFTTPAPALLPTSGRLCCTKNTREKLLLAGVRRKLGSIKRS